MPVMGFFSWVVPLARDPHSLMDDHSANSSPLSPQDYNSVGSNDGRQTKCSSLKILPIISNKLKGRTLTQSRFRTSCYRFRGLIKYWKIPLNGWSIFLRFMSVAQNHQNKIRHFEGCDVRNQAPHRVAHPCVGSS